MTPAAAARRVAFGLSLSGTPEQDLIAAAFEKFADLLDPPADEPCPDCTCIGFHAKGCLVAESETGS